MISESTKYFIEKIPKAELHCHLEGAMQPSTVLALGEKNKYSLPFQDEEGAKRFYDFTGLNEFIGIYRLACNVLQDEEDFTC